MVVVIHSHVVYVGHILTVDGGRLTVTGVLEYRSTCRLFAAQLPHLIWQTVDVTDNHTGIQVWIGDSTQANVLPPLN